MGLKIEDGKGSGISAEVNSKNRLKVDSDTQLTSATVSDEAGLCFNAVSVDSSAAAGEYILYFKNTSTSKKFYVDLIRVGTVNAALFKIATVTGTAAGSSALTPVNLNLTSGKEAEATCRGDGAITGLTEDSVIAVTRVSAATSSNIPFDDTLILGPNDAIAVEYDTGTTGAAEVLLRGYYQ